MTALTAEIRARMDKVRALIDSPNPGEAAAARARYAEMQTKYGTAREPEPIWRQDLSERLSHHQAQRAKAIAQLADQAVGDLIDKGYFVHDLNGEWLITPADDLARIIHRGHDPAYLIAVAAMIPTASELPA